MTALPGAAIRAVLRMRAWWRSFSVDYDAAAAIQKSYRDQAKRRP